ncbi:hypothetical protein Scep_029201 [Stephania cephalantha]|uniref:MORF/ORRM1/DAG-like MORF domain-containing protein n=1 Tax=Stephania cephalantha TaxID=152367 RepID=A0AAP0E064_9MAGN
MALTLRTRKTLTLTSSLLKTCRFISSTTTTTTTTTTTISNAIAPQNPRRRPNLMVQSHWFRSTSLASSSRSYNNNNNDDDKISPDTILFEGCDYNHWLITMEFPKDPKPTAEEMVETYVQTLAKVVGSVEEAKKRMYACSTTTYNGFQAVMTEEMSEKFRGLPGVVFILPDSYIDPVNKEYGGDKYINGTIIPRPPPVQYGRQGRYGDRNRNYDRPRFDRTSGQGPPQGGQPYGQGPPQGGQPYGQGPPQGSQPYGQGPPQGSQPYGQGPPQGGQPYGQGPPQGFQPYGQGPPQGNQPYGQGPPQVSQPYGQGPPQGDGRNPMDQRNQPQDRQGFGQVDGRNYQYQAQHSHPPNQNYGPSGQGQYGNNGPPPQGNYNYGGYFSQGQKDFGGGNKNFGPPSGGNYWQGGGSGYNSNYPGYGEAQQGSYQKEQKDGAQGEQRNNAPPGQTDPGQH